MPGANVLMCCHTSEITQKLDGSITGHWFNDLFKLFLDLSCRYTFTSVDKTPLRANDNSYICADIFSDSFINEHKEQFDIVFVPDCSFLLGLTETELKDNGIEKIKNRVSILTRLLRTDDSILYIGKLCVSDIIREDVILLELSQVYEKMIVKFDSSIRFTVGIKR